MSDKKEDGRKNSGFARKENRKYINRPGRPKGSTSKIPTNKDVQDLILKNTEWAFKEALDLYDDPKCNISNKLAIVKWFGQLGIDILKEREALKAWKVTKEDPKPEDKPDNKNSDGKVVSFKKS